MGRKFLGLITVVSLLFMSCSKDMLDAATPMENQEIIDAFNEQFPDAMNVIWQSDRDYAIVTFELLRARSATEQNKAWYERGLDHVICNLLEKDVEFNQLPDKVINAWNSSSLKREGFQVDEIDLLVRAEVMTYKLNVEKGEIEKNVYYDQNGTVLLIQDMLDSDDDNIPTPFILDEFISGRYPGAFSISCELEEEDDLLFYEIEFIDDECRKFIRNSELEVTKCAKFRFDKTWLYTVTEIEESAIHDTRLVPSVVIEAAKLHTNEEIEEVNRIDFMVTADDFLLYEIGDILFQSNGDIYEGDIPGYID